MTENPCDRREKDQTPDTNEKTVGKPENHTKKLLESPP